MYNYQTDISGSRAAHYKRKSQEARDRQVLSLESQEDICNELLERYKLSPVCSFAEKKTAHIPDVRPKFDEMISLFLKRKVDVVVCWRLSRLARNMKEAGLIVHLLQTGVIKAIVTESRVYFPHENTFIQILELASDTQYSRDIKTGVRTGNTKKLKLGLPNGKAPIGYLNNTHKAQGKKDWRDDPERLGIMKLAYQEILSRNKTPHEVWRWLRDTMKLTTVRSTHRGGCLIGKNTFYNTLRRTEYAKVRFSKDGQVVPITCDMTPIITLDQYWEIQEILGIRGVPRPKGQKRAYTGFLRSPEGDFLCQEVKFHLVCDCKWKFSHRYQKNCPKCGKHQDDMQNPIYRRYVLYYNNRRRKNGLGSKTVNEKRVIEPFLISYAKENFSFSQSLADWSRKYIAEMKQEDLNLEAQKRTQQEKYLKELHVKRKRAKQALLNGTFSEEEYREISTKLAREESSVIQSPLKIDWNEELLKVVDLAESFISIIEKGEIEDKRKLLAQMHSTLIWDEEKLSIINAKWMDTLINGLKKIRSQNQGFEPLKYVENKGDLDDFGQTCPLLCRLWEDVRTSLMEVSNSFEN